MVALIPSGDLIKDTAFRLDYDTADFSDKSLVLSLLRRAARRALKLAVYSL